MQTEWKAASSDAQLRAFDLADEVGHLWLASEATESAAQRGTAAAGRKEHLPVHLGALRHSRCGLWI
eukprot:2876453-Pyramimonas_sp.AAC.1